MENQYKEYNEKSNFGCGYNKEMFGQKPDKKHKHKHNVDYNFECAKTSHSEPNVTYNYSNPMTHTPEDYVNEKISYDTNKKQEFYQQLNFEKNMEQYNESYDYENNTINKAKQVAIQKVKDKKQTNKISLYAIIFIMIFLLIFVCLMPISIPIVLFIFISIIKTNKKENLEKYLLENQYEYFQIPIKKKTKNDGKYYFHYQFNNTIRREEVAATIWATTSQADYLHVFVLNNKNKTHIIVSKAEIKK